MKKIIWLFGQPGSGRQTLINNINNDQIGVKRLLGVENKKISIVKLPYDRDNATTDYRYLDNRRKTIYNYITSFIQDDNDVIMICGEYADYENKSDCTLKRIPIDFPDLEKEILFLNPSDENELYERMKNTEFFKSNYQMNLGRFSKTWLDFAINYMRNSLLDCEEVGYKVYEVDTLNGYSINEQTKPKSI